MILFFLRFNSTSDFMPERFSITSIWLLERFNTLNAWSLLIFSILEILFSCKSRTSRFLKWSNGYFSPSIRFFESISTRRLSTTDYKFEISLILFILRSMKVRFGSETRFSILEISLFCKFRYLIRSSPSSKGTCFKHLESRFIFSTLVSRSLGLL